MAEFSKLVITGKGQALISKVLTGSEGITFTKISTSDEVYELEQLEGKVELEGIKQTSKISKVTRSNDVSVMVEAAFTNTELTEGYYMRTLGLYAVDPDEGEILYALTIETSGNCFMPPYNGLTVSGAYIKLVTSIGNADNVSLEVDQAAVATLGNIEELEEKITELRDLIGYTDDDILGVEVDFKNMRFTRLAGAVNKEPGADFDSYKCFGGRRRCNLTNDGRVYAYYGDGNFTTSVVVPNGQIILPGQVSVPAGSPIQMMVEQPKFYYKVVPLKLEKISGGSGYHIRKARYYVSDNKISGFKLHPAFIQNGIEKDKIYLSAFESCIWSVSKNSYNLNNEKPVNYETDILSSIIDAKPLKNTMRSATRKAAANRGDGWFQSYIATMSATQLLALIEYASFNMQAEIGMGSPITGNAKTGGTISLGNNSGSITNEDGSQYTSYRGEENLWGDTKFWVDGINMYYKKSIFAGGDIFNNTYIADHDFMDKTDEGYNHVEFMASVSDGYISAFGYSPNYDWLFIPSECKGNSSLPVGDYFALHTFSPNSEQWAFITNGGGNEQEKGLFSIDGDSIILFGGDESYVSDTGARLVYIPQN